MLLTQWHRLDCASYLLDSSVTSYSGTGNTFGIESVVLVTQIHLHVPGKVIGKVIAEGFVKQNSILVVKMWCEK
jgi:hypothetical protein